MPVFDGRDAEVGSRDGVDVRVRLAERHAGPNRSHVLEPRSLPPGGNLGEPLQRGRLSRVTRAFPGRVSCDDDGTSLFQALDELSLECDESLDFGDPERI